MSWECRDKELRFSSLPSGKRALICILFGCSVVSHENTMRVESPPFERAAAYLVWRQHRLLAVQDKPATQHRGISPRLE